MMQKIRDAIGLDIFDNWLKQIEKNEDWFSEISGRQDVQPKQIFLQKVRGIEGNNDKSHIDCARPS